MSEATQPIIPWMGGKRRLADQLLPLFPPHECYVELFTGGAALFFMREHPAKTDVINDINGELVNLYRVVRCHFDEFCRHFEFMLGSREDWDWFQAVNLKTLTDIQRAVHFFFLQQHAFGGKIDGQNFGYATTGRAFDIATVRERLAAAHRRLSGAYIEHGDWLTCVERYDRPHTFFYADPPYWETTGYGVDFEWSQFERLAEAMRNMKGKLMLSINDHPDIAALFSEFWMRRLEIKYTVSNSTDLKTSGELVICNFTPVEKQAALF